LKIYLILQNGFKSEACQKRYQYFREKFDGKKIILGIDRLDYTKGIELKLHAWEKFLQTYPQYKESAVLIQVGVPTRQDVVEYQNLISHVNEHVGRINSTFGTLDGFPIHYINKSVNFDDLCALYALADALIVTSIRDGMNLVSSEFVAVQDERCQQEGVNFDELNDSPQGMSPTNGSSNHQEKLECNKNVRKPPGVLILSEFAGAARSLGGSIIINPFNIDLTAKAIFDSFEMGDKERTARHSQNYNVVATNTATKWGQDFLHEFEVACRYQNDPTLFHKLSSTPIPRLIFDDRLKRVFNRTQKRLFCFDYDGTLVSLHKYPSLALPTTYLVNILNALTSNPKNFVYIITGRDKKTMMRFLGKLPNLGIVAEHGMYCRHPGEKEWTSLYQYEDIDLDWMKDVVPVLQHVESRTPGSFVEVKETSLVFHYRNADPEYGSWQANELKLHLEMSFNSKPMEIIRGKKVIEIRPVGVNKGIAAKKLIENTPDFDLVFCGGDDATDEQMFEEVEKFSFHAFTSSSPNRRRSADMSPLGRKILNIPPKEVFTCVVGTQNAQFSKAHFQINNHDELLDTLEEIIDWSKHHDQ
jgi:trehalose 6-phosphate synthase/phosphatase